MHKYIVQTRSLQVRRADKLKKLTINDSKYYESKTATTSYAQIDLTRNLETVTHTSNSNETVTRTSNRNFEQTILSNRTIPVVILTMIPRTEQRIVPIVMASKMLLTPATKEVVADMASSDAWVNRNPL